MIVQAVVTIILVTLVCGICNYFMTSDINIGGEGLSRDDSSILKGLAIIMVVIGHIGTAIPGLRVFTPLGAVGVCLFLFLSGYGIEKSFAKNGRYHYWQKRIFNVWLPYGIIETIALPLHCNLGMSDLVADYLLIHPLHPFGWYMQFLFIWYILYWVSTFFRNEKLQMIMLALFAIVIVAIWESTQAQNSFSFLLGTFVAKNRSCTKFLNSKYLLVFSFVTLFTFILRDCMKGDREQLYLIWKIISLFYYTSFGIATIIGYKLASVKTRKLPYGGFIGIGLVSYELYLVHGYFYSIFEDGTDVVKIILFFAFIMFCSVMMYYFDCWLKRKIAIK